MALAITNRFGTSVFRSTDYHDNFNGIDLSSGVYFSGIEMRGCSEKKKGALHIIH
jgi:hypothetical protein